MPHPALQPNRTAVITGGASGIGLATAERLAAAGMNICLADLDADALEKAGPRIAEQAPRGADAVLAMPTDVSDARSLEALRDAAIDRFGSLAFLMNNAGIGGGGKPWENPEGWQKVLGVNLGGVLNGLQTFVPFLIEQNEPAAIVNTGSKQGITQPPGDSAYNVSKAGIKALTENLARELRGIEGNRISAHLLVPGFTYTGMIKRFIKEKPDAAWTPEQVADFLLESIGRGDFYVLCPDNEVTAEIDRKRIEWAAGDLTENRSALSRWDPEYEAEFNAFMKKAER